jgi:hypothetical protein
MTAISRSRTRFHPIIGLLLGLSLLLGACGGATADAPELDALPDDAIPAAEEDAVEEQPATDEDAATEPLEQAVEEVTEDPAAAPPDGAAGDCSASGHTVTIAPAPGLPVEVLALREFLIDAALRCDEQLLFTAMEESDQFSFSFGGDPDALSLWWAMEEAGDEPFLRLAQVLATTPALAESGGTYVWPRVTTGRQEDTTAEAWAELVWLDETQRGDRHGDGYLDWRAGISTDGQWRFFVVGD